MRGRVRCDAGDDAPRPKAGQRPAGTCRRRRTRRCRRTAPGKGACAARRRRSGAGPPSTAWRARGCAGRSDPGRCALVQVEGLDQRPAVFKALKPPGVVRAAVVGPAGSSRFTQASRRPSSMKLGMIGRHWTTSPAGTSGHSLLRIGPPRVARLAVTGGRGQGRVRAPSPARLGSAGTKNLRLRLRSDLSRGQIFGWQLASRTLRDFGAQPPSMSSRITRHPGWATVPGSCRLPSDRRPSWSSSCCRDT